MLFLGGLFLGAAATKYRLDVNLGRVLLGPFGTSPRWVMLGMMLVTALFSMFMSNTATTAMMLAVLMPVLRAIEPGDPARTGFALSIPFAANIGGIGTPIGTPPNAVALKYLTPGLFGEAGGSPLIGFGTWMGFAVPFMLVLLFLAWALLLLMFRPRKPTVEVDFAGTWVRSPRAWVVYVVSLLTIGLWLTGGRVHGMSSPVVAMIPVGAFLATGVMDSRDLKGIGWDVLWLIAGGFALGMALEASGLAEGLVASIPFGAMPVLAVLGVACFLTWLMASFMSNTATANLMLPVMASLAVALPALDSLGGPVLLLLAVTFCASLSMILPISTPPNALAYASGWIRTPDMVRMGLAVGVMGGALLVVMLAILRWIGFFAGFGPGAGG